LPNFPVLKRLSAILLLVCIAQAPVAHAVLLSVQPDTTFAANDDLVSLDIVVSGLGNFGPDSLGAFDVFMGYDATVLSFSGYSLNNLLGDLGGQAIDSSAGDLGGSVNIAEVSLLAAAVLDALQPDEFIMASLNFDVLDLAIGATTELSILPGAVLSSAFGQPLSVTGGLSATIEGRAAVPLMGTLWLLLGGFISWSAARRLRKPGN
jgi:hypothetical protein